jgi:chemotaxis protein MotA
MDIASAIGIILVLVGVFVGSAMKGVDLNAFFNVPAALLIVIVATVGAAMIGSHVDDVKGLGRVFLKAFMPGPSKDPAKVIDDVVRYAEQARREGLLALEDKVGGVDDPFLRKGLQLAIDGIDSETLRETMETEITAMKHRHKAGIKLFTSMGIFAPTFGIIGAVVGLIATLSNLDDPSKLGHGIAAAFIATFWGVFAANGIFLPVANKLTRLSLQEVTYKEVIVEGVLSIQAGSNPRMVGDMLRCYLPPSVQAKYEERKSA